MGESVYGIVCAARDSGEADRIAVVFGPDCGKVTAFVKSARKPGSKLAGSTRPFCEGAFHVERGRGRAILTGAEIKRSHAAVQGDMRKLALGSLFLEILDSGHWPEDLWEPMYRLIINSLAALGKLDDGGHLAAMRSLAAFVWAKITKLSGVYPDVSSCAGCGKPMLAGDCMFDRGYEHAYHLACAKLTPSGKPSGHAISAETVAAIYRIYDVPLRKFDTGWAMNAAIEDVERVLFRIVERVLDAPLKSRRFLEKAMGW